MGFKRPSLPELIQRIDNDIVSRQPGAQAALAKRMTQVVATAEAGAVHGLYGYLQWLERQLFPETCDDDLLHLHSVGVPRREAAAASGVIAVAGNAGAVIDAGTVWQTDGSEYRATSDVTLESSSASVPVDAVTSGAGGDLAPGSELRLISPVAGVNAVATVAAPGIAGGADIETPARWRDRIMARRARVPRGGARDDWEEWALQVPGVTRAWEQPLGMGAGTVVLRIMADDASTGPLPMQQLLDDVIAHIEPLRNVTAHLYVVAPVPIDFRPRLRIEPDNTETRAAVKNALRDLILRAGEPGGRLLISQIRNAIGTAGGVNDYELSAPTANVEYASGELPVWGGIEWL